MAKVTVSTSELAALIAAVSAALDGLPDIDTDEPVASRVRRNIAIDNAFLTLHAHHGAQFRHGAPARFRLADITSASEMGVVGAARNWCTAARKHLEGAQ